MKQREVKIIGLSLNKSLGILDAREVKFDKDNKLIVIKGASGNGKSTFQEAIQVGIHGTKAMKDNQKYGEIDLELQLTDGDLPIFVGRRSKDKTIVSTLYIKKPDGKIDKKPIIDGIEATASKYFEHLETALTWRMPELTSDSPAIQKKVLLSMYQSQLTTIGVIFDKMHPKYENSIRGKIDKAVKHREDKNYEREKVGGVADHLIKQGFDPDRPDTCPDSVNIGEIEQKIKEAEKERTTLKAAPEAKKAQDLAEIKADAAGITNKCLAYNSELKAEFDAENKKFNDYLSEVETIKFNVNGVRAHIRTLAVNGHIDPNYVPDLMISEFDKRIKWPKEQKEPKEPIYIQFEENGQVAISPDCNSEGQELLKTLSGLRVQYANTVNEDSTTDVSKFDKQIEDLEQNKKDGIEINKIVTAIDSFHYWREANEDVVRLKDEYVKLLSQVDTGVEGLEIQPVEDDIFLMYDGSYDIEYFQPKEKKRVMRKLSSYSGTQKPVICLLIQNYLLSKKPKALRYMYIDDVPMDRRVRALLEKMTEELNLTTFLNITGDFEKENLQAGEILINGGEIFF